MSRILDNSGIRGLIKEAVVGAAVGLAGAAVRGAIRRPGVAITGAFGVSDTLSGAAKLSGRTKEGVASGMESSQQRQTF